MFKLFSARAIFFVFLSHKKSSDIDNSNAKIVMRNSLTLRFASYTSIKSTIAHLNLKIQNLRELNIQIGKIV